MTRCPIPPDSHLGRGGRIRAPLGRFHHRCDHGAYRPPVVAAEISRVTTGSFLAVRSVVHAAVGVHGPLLAIGALSCRTKSLREIHQ